MFQLTRLYNKSCCFTLLLKKTGMASPILPILVFIVILFASALLARKVNNIFVAKGNKWSWLITLVTFLASAAILSTAILAIIISQVGFGR